MPVHLRLRIEFGSSLAATDSLLPWPAQLQSRCLCRPAWHSGRIGKGAGYQPNSPATACRSSQNNTNLMETTKRQYPSSESCCDSKLPEEGLIRAIKLAERAVELQQAYRVGHISLPYRCLTVAQGMQERICRHTRTALATRVIAAGTYARPSADLFRRPPIRCKLIGANASVERLGS